VTVTIDGYEISVPKGTLVIRAAETIGITIPRFCDHPLIDPIGACRQCLVDIEGQRKPLASCTTYCTDGMVVKTQYTSAVAEEGAARRDGTAASSTTRSTARCATRAGECPLQNQAVANGQGESRFREPKREFDKPVAISTEVLLDRERCISCTRCVRTSEEIAGDDFIEFLSGGRASNIGTATGKPFNSYFSGNTVQVCPVGALTGAQYRFQVAPVRPGVHAEHLRALRVRVPPAHRHRRGRVLRRLAGNEPLVNEEWNCDKGRWAFAYASQSDRLTTPLVRDGDGILRPAAWQARPRGRRGWPHRRPGRGAGKHGRGPVRGRRADRRPAHA